MLTRILLVTLLSSLVMACDRPTGQLDADNETCELALRKGRLDIAEAACQRALGDHDGATLAAPIRSARLYRLATIKRKLAKYDEAAELLKPSLALEQTLSGPDSPEIARRWLEMSLILAGQQHWQEGAQLLEQTVPMADRLSEKERGALLNILQHYVAQLQKSQQVDLASRLQAAADSLGDINPRPSHNENR